MPKRPLKERLGLISTAEAPTPKLNVPASDNAKDLAAAAESGFAAIQELYADRNKSVELAQSLHRHNVYLMNINNSLRGELAHARQERDYYLKLNAQIACQVAGSIDALQRVYSAIGHTSAVIEAMPSSPLPTNNPDVPELDTIGRPVESQEDDEEQQDRPRFNRDGLPEGPPPISPGELRALAAKLVNGQGASS